MIVMLDTPQPLDSCAEQLGGLKVLQFFSPETFRKPQRPEEHFAIDNGAFGKFREETFLRLVERERPRKDLCLFLTVPDVVGDARRTAEVFAIWRRRPELAGWPLAYVCQDGQEDLPLPWQYCSAIFIGGSTDWKESRHAAACIKAAKVLGKHVHVGRVNTPKRYKLFAAICSDTDTCDGTGIARYDHMRKAFVFAGSDEGPALDLQFQS